MSTPKILLVQTLFVVTLVLIFSHSALAATNSVNVWWPADGASVSGTQPFKAVVDNISSNAYSMYWQVDGGSLNNMPDNSTDYPHKEVSVDLSGWNWNASANYTLTFMAKDASGQEIASKNVVIKNSAQQSALSPVVVPQPASTLAPVVVPTQTTTPAPTPIPAQIQPSQVSINVWWPTNNTSVLGIQPIKAVVSNMNLSSYKLYWSLSAGQKTELLDTQAEGPHKENSIDFTSWNWMGNKPYVITLTATDLSGNVISTTTVSVLVPQATAPVVLPVQTPSTNSIFNGLGLYVDPNSPASTQVTLWKTSRPADAVVMQKIAAQSSAVWLGGWNVDVAKDVKTAVAAATPKNSVATFVLYNIPGRDCSSYSAGGASSPAAYAAWIKSVSSGLGAGKAILIVEPDAIAGMDCLSGQLQSDRYAMLQNAVTTFKANNPNALVYLDAGHAGWIDPSDMAGRLAKAGISNVAGFSLNVSNFETTANNTAYGQQISTLTNNAHFVIDTSRNGSGSNGQWCNPSGRSLGQAPTLNTGNSLVDAYLWIKRAGESDGNCNGGPNAGTWWPDYALDMAKRAGY